MSISVALQQVFRKRLPPEKAGKHRAVFQLDDVRILFSPLERKDRLGRPVPRSAAVARFHVGQVICRIDMGEESRYLPGTVPGSPESDDNLSVSEFARAGKATVIVAIAVDDHVLQDSQCGHDPAFCDCR